MQVFVNFILDFLISVIAQRNIHTRFVVHDPARRGNFEIKNEVGLPRRYSCVSSKSKGMTATKGPEPNSLSQVKLSSPH
jgi:hypothetical protein